MGSLRTRTTMVLACVFLTSLPSGAVAQTFKIANWNVRSGEGIHGLAGGRRLLFANKGAPKVTTPSPGPRTYVELTFNASANTPYHLWIRGHALDDCWCNDSAWIQYSDAVDDRGAAVHRIGSGAADVYSLEECLNRGVAGWAWNDTHWGVMGALGANIQFANDGAHTIRIQPREDGWSIDQIVLSASRYLSSAPGTNKLDATIVPR